MVERVRPQRFGLNQNYVFPNKEQSFWQSAPLSYRKETQDSAPVQYWQYNFDGIDDYVQLPNLTLSIGDTVELTINPNSLSTLMVLFGNVYIQNGLLDWDGDASLWEVELGGVVVPKYEPIALGVEQTLRMTRRVSTLTFDFIGRYTSSNYFFNGVIKNVHIIRANPTNQYPDLFYPIDDGQGATVIKQTLTSQDNWDATPFNFNDERWENV